MNQCQKYQSLLLDILHASQGVPRAETWLITECRLAGYVNASIRDSLDTLETHNLVSSKLDPLGVRRWEITQKGILTIEQL